MRWILLFALAACTKTSETDVVDTDGDADTDTDADTDVDNDVDNDGFSPPEDCNDQDAGIHPDAVETCDGRDEDCDTVVDDGVLITVYADADGDHYGTGDATEACEIGVGQADNGDDCNDADGAVNPGAPELCDGLDNNCLRDIESGAVFYGTTSFTYTDVSAEWATGTDGAPLLWSPAEAGSLMVCSGPWFVSIDTAYSLDIYSLQGPDLAILSGGHAAPLVRVRGKGSAVTINSVTLQDGAAVETASWYPDPTATFGGSVWCTGKNTVGLTDAVVEGGTAVGGAGIYAESCAVTIDHTTLEGNTASYGGGALMTIESTVTLTNSLITGNDGGTYAGAIAATTFSSATLGSLTLTDTEVSSNTGAIAGGIYAERTPVTCTGSATTRGGFFLNTAYGVYISDGATFEARTCDFGTLAGADDNTPADIRWDTSSMNADNDQSFSCDSGSGCSP